MLAALGTVALAQAPTSPATVPPKLPIKLFAQLERTLNVDIAPDGKHFVRVANRDGRHSVVIQNLPVDSGKAIILPALEETSFEYYWAKWSGNQRVLIGAIASAERGLQGRYYWLRGRETRLFSLAADGSGFRNVVRPFNQSQTGSLVARAAAGSTAAIQDDVIDWLPDEEDRVLVAIDEVPSPTSGLSVRRIDVRTGDYTHVLGAFPSVRQWVTDRSGVPRLGWIQSRQSGSVQRSLVYRNPDSDQWQERPKSPFVVSDYRFLAFDADPRFALVIGTERQRRVLMRWNMLTDQPVATLFRDPDADVVDLVSADKGRQDVLGVRLEGKPDQFFQPLWQQRQRMLAAALPGMGFEIVSTSKDQLQMIVKAHSDTEPGVYYHFDAAKRQLSVVAYSYDTLDPSQLASVKSVSYAARDGLSIPALLTLPRGRKETSLPVVVLPHGGPWANDEQNSFHWLAQFLANRGYAVLQPNFRGSTGHGIAFLRAGNRQWGLKMQDDLTDGVLWLIQQGIADPARICIVGGSYGGYAALMGAVKTPKLYRCAVSLNGVSDLPALLTTDTGGFKDEVSARLVGDTSLDRDQLERTSPVRQIEKIRIPILLVHAKDDARVGIEQSERMHSALVAAGKSSDFVAIESGDHWLMNENARTTFLTALEAFLERNLPQQ